MTGAFSPCPGATAEPAGGSFENKIQVKDKPASERAKNVQALVHVIPVCFAYKFTSTEKYFANGMTDTTSVAHCQCQTRLIAVNSGTYNIHIYITNTH
jgi:hypothetical protein